MLLVPDLTPLDPDTKLNSLPTPALIALADPDVVTESSVRCRIWLLAFKLSFKLPNLRAFLYLALFTLIT